MSTHIATGFSPSSDSASAFKEAAIEVKTRLNQSSVNLVIVFCSPQYAQNEHLALVQRILQPEKFIGATTTGIILSSSIETRGVGILAITSDEIHFNTGLKDQLRLFPLQDAGLQFAKELSTGFDRSTRQAMIFFLSGLKRNNTPIIRGLQENLGRAFPLVGAVPCDGLGLGQSTQIFQQHFYKDAIVGLLLGGQITFATASRHGWHPLGKPRIINDGEGNLVRLIDNKPALTFYEDYFKEELTRSNHKQLDEIGALYPMGLNTEKPKEYLIRSPIEALPDGELIVHAEIPPGSQCHLMMGDKDSCRAAAHDAAIDVREQLHGKPPKLILIFESLARRKLLGRSAWQEIVLIKEILGLTTPVFGMYTYGEIAPLGSLKDAPNTQIQDASIVIAAIG